jgi:hypothetical protein
MHTHRATVIDRRIAKSGRNGKSLARESRNPARMATTPRERAEKAAEMADQRATRNAEPGKNGNCSHGNSTRGGKNGKSAQRFRLGSCRFSPSRAALAPHPPPWGRERG